MTGKGKKKPILTSTSAFGDSNHEIVGYIVTARDFTQYKQAQNARIKAEEQLEVQRTQSMRADRLRSLGEMAAGIAHELNHPLVGVRGLAEHTLIGLEKGWELNDEVLKERLEGIIEQADRMVHIIQHVRLFAREAGKPELSRVKVNGVVASSVDLVDAQFRSHGISLDSDFGDGLPTVEANPYSLEEVLLNLLNNAKDAIEEHMSSENLAGA